MKILMGAAVCLGAVFGGGVANGQVFDETGVIAEFHSKRAAASPPPSSEVWVQPGNRQEDCAIVFDSAPSEAKWFGDCRDGRAFGLGIVVARNHSPAWLNIAVEEYTGPSKDDAIVYRQITRAPNGSIEIRAGRVTMESQSEVEGLFVGKTASGNTQVGAVRQHCSDGTCVTRVTDTMTGSVTYNLSANSYRVFWNEQRIDNQLLFTSRQLLMDGALRAEKIVFDGAAYDFGTDLLSGSTSRGLFSNEMNSILLLPFERYAALSPEIDAAVQISDSKFAAVQTRFCNDQADPDVAMICNPSSLLPPDNELAASKSEFEEVGRSGLANLRRNAAAASASAAQSAQVQAEQRRLQEENSRLQARERREALNRGIQALNEAGQAAQRAGQQMSGQHGGYQAPQVETPTLRRPGVVHCRTIGYITTCH